MIQKDKIRSYITNKEVLKKDLEKELIEIEYTIGILKEAQPSSWLRAVYYIFKSLIIVLLLLSPFILYFHIPILLNTVLSFWQAYLIACVVLLYIVRLNNIIRKKHTLSRVMYKDLIAIAERYKEIIKAQQKDIKELEDLIKN